MAKLHTASRALLPGSDPEGSRCRVVPPRTEGSPGPFGVTCPSVCGLRAPEPHWTNLPSPSLCGASSHPRCLLPAARSRGSHQEAPGDADPACPDLLITRFPGSHTLQAGGRTGVSEDGQLKGAHSSPEPAAPMQEANRLPAPGRASRPCWN